MDTISYPHEKKKTQKETNHHDSHTKKTDKHHVHSDSGMFSTLVDPDARFVRTGYQADGSPDVTSYPKEYFVSTLKKTQKGVLEESIDQPFVQMRDNLAHVWCRYVCVMCKCVCVFD
jgi:hypothetical protein